jgi:CheY-like chemotaxis protein
MSFAELNHGRANLQHAIKAASELGLSLDSMAEANGSFSPSTTIVPQRAVVVLPPPVEAEVRRQRLDYRRALVLCPRPGCGSIICEYFERWSVQCDSGPTFEIGARKIKETNKRLQAEKKRPKQVTIVVADIDGSAEDAARRVPDSMLGKSDLRFIFLYSCEEQLRRDGRTPWFAVAKSHVLLKKPFRRQELWDAVTGSNRQTVKRPTAPTAPKSPTAEASAKPPRLFLVDDDGLNIMIAMRYIAEAGLDAAEVAVAKNGQECVNMVRSRMRGSSAAAPHGIELILMDCQMSTMDGFEATVLVRGMERLSAPGQPAIPIVAMTGYAAAEERDKCLGVGMSDHLAKPFQMAQLKEMLVKYLIKFKP